MSDMDRTDLAVEVSGLAFGYGRRRVLEGIDLTVPAGSVTGIVGINGVGKSTLLRVLAAELASRTGTVRVLGRKPARAKILVGWVPDRVVLPRWMRVRDHLRLLEPFYPTWDADEAQRLLDLLGVELDARYSDLSKGQRALENLVCALAHRPRLLLLDEPFSGLDPFARKRVFEGVLDHLRAEGRTVVVVSHSLVDLERCVDRIALLRAGRIVLCEDLERLQQRTARVRVVLAEDGLEENMQEKSVEWAPPGDPLVENGGEGDGAEWTLFYLDWSDEIRAALEGDERVRHVELMARDLEDVLVAANDEERVA